MILALVWFERILMMVLMMITAMAVVMMMLGIPNSAYFSFIIFMSMDFAVPAAAATDDEYNAYQEFGKTKHPFDVMHRLVRMILMRVKMNDSQTQRS